VEVLQKKPYLLLQAVNPTNCADDRKKIDVLHELLDAFHAYAHGYCCEEAKPERSAKSSSLIPQTTFFLSGKKSFSPYRRHSLPLEYILADAPPISPAITSSMNGPSFARYRVLIYRTYIFKDTFVAADVFGYAHTDDLSTIK